MYTTSVLYISAFQFSGSTLLSLLLNDHDEITTVGHMTGWPAATNAFRCSCGDLLHQCRFYKAIQKVFESEHMAFDVRNFGTAYKIVRPARLNRALTASLPYLDNSSIEQLRDKVVRHLPRLGRNLDRIDRANLVFINEALRLSGASVFVDNSHSPYRLRHLSQIAGLRVHNVHLIRDPRGSVLSAMTNSKWQIESATRLWLRQQALILRIATESERSLTVFYEDLCTETDSTLAAIHRFGGLDPQPFGGDFTEKHHHVLGNEMRLGPGAIRLDDRWKRDLSPEDRRYIERETLRASRKKPELAAIVDRYVA